MKKHIALFFIIFLIVINVFGLNAVVFPTVCIGFSDESYVDLSNKVELSLKNRGFSLIDKNVIEKLCFEKSVSFQDVEYDRNISNEIGNIVNAEYLYFNTLIWNGESFLIDFHRLDIDANSYWHKTYSFEKETLDNGEFSKYGIEYIISDSFVKKGNSKNIFSSSNTINDSEEYIDTIIWMRKNKVSNLFLCFGAISGFEKNQYQRYKTLGLYSSTNEKIELYKSILNTVLHEKDIIEKSGEIARVIHLGSYNRMPIYIFNEESIEIGYPYIKDILESDLNGVKFYGTKEESALIESLLTRDQRNRYWLRYYWE